MTTANKKAAMDRKLIKVYEDYGLQAFLKVCSEMLDIRDRTNGDKKKKSNGEVCEVVLYVMTLYYLEKYNLTGKPYHSLVLPDVKNSSSDFCTETDFTLMTPGICLTGECKSFVGDITATSKCTLNRGSFKADVGKQSQLHGEVLRGHLSKCLKQDKRIKLYPYAMFCFLYSNGTLNDVRTKADKNNIPIVTVATLFSFYDKIFEHYKEPVYQYDKAVKMFDYYYTSKELRERHRRYLGY